MDLAAAVRAVDAEARRRLDVRASAEELLAYHERSLPSAAVEGVRDHLALCGDCAQAALDLAALAAPEAFPAETGASAAAVAAEWETIRGVLEEEGRLTKPAAGAQSTVRFRRSRRFASPRFAYAMAAAAVLFCATTVMLTLGLVAARRTLSELGQPRVNVQLVDLQPEGSPLQRDESSLAPATTGDEPVVFILQVLEPGSYPGYRVEILELLDSGDNTVWTSDALVPSPQKEFTFELPRRWLPGERYRILLSGIDGTKEKILATYNLRFEPPPSPRGD